MKCTHCTRYYSHQQDKYNKVYLKFNHNSNFSFKENERKKITD